MKNAVILSSFDFWLIAGLVTVLLFIIGWFLTRLHSQAMTKCDLMIKEMKGMVTQQAVHSEKLSVGTNEFKKIEQHQKEQDVAIAKIQVQLAKITVLVKP